MKASDPPIGMGSGFLVDKAPGALRAKLVLLALAIGFAVFIWLSAEWWLDHRNLSWGILGLLGLGSLIAVLTGLREIEQRVDLDENDILISHGRAVVGIVVLGTAFVGVLIIATFTN